MKPGAPEIKAALKKVNGAARTIETAILKADSACGYQPHMRRLFNSALRNLEFLEERAKKHASRI